MVAKASNSQSQPGRLPRFLFFVLFTATTALIVWLVLASQDVAWPPPAADIALNLESTRKYEAALVASRRAMEMARLKKEQADRQAEKEKQRKIAAARRLEERRIAALQAKERKAAEARRAKERELAAARAKKAREAEIAAQAKRDKTRLAELKHADPDVAAEHAAPPTENHHTEAPPAAAPDSAPLAVPPARLAKKVEHNKAPRKPSGSDHAAPPPAPQLAGPAKKPEAKKPEAKKPEAKKPEAKKPEAKQSEGGPSPVASGAPQKLTPKKAPETPAKIARKPPPKFLLAKLAPGEPLKPAPDPALIEETAQGPLPVISKDGKKSWKAYARPFDKKDQRPRVAIVIGGLGLDSDLTRAAIERLPAHVTLAFVPYTDKLEMWIKLARRAGHEVLLSVPMEPQDYPAVDPGPKTLLTSLGPRENRERLLWSLGRVSGYIGIADFMGSRFTLSRLDLLRLFRELKKRGLMFVDTRSGPRSAVAEVAGDSGIPWVGSSLRLGNRADAAAIDRDLEQLERFARENGSALGTASPLPVAYDRIARWVKTLGKKGLALAPASAIVQIEEENKE